MQSRQIVAHHSSRSSTRRNTQSIPLLAGLFCASLTGCILEQQNGSSIDIPDLTTLPDLRADLLPAPDLAAPCGSDGFLFMGKCIYDFYLPDAPSCAGKSINLYDQGSRFAQICDCKCDKSSLEATLDYGTNCNGMALTPVLASQNCTTATFSGSNLMYSITKGMCNTVGTPWSDWRLETGKNHSYCRLSSESHQVATQECILLDGDVTCPADRYKERRGLFVISPATSPDPAKCNCCGPSDYTDIPLILYPARMCSGMALPSFPQNYCALFSTLVVQAKSAKWNPNHCPPSYSKTLPATAQIVATQTVCCKLP